MPSEADIWRPMTRDIPASVGLLTRLPIKVDGDWAQSRGAAGAWAYPIVGIFVAVLVLICGALLNLFDLPKPLVGIGMVVTGLFVTGAMHEDGLADTLDGLWGGWTKNRRLEIMKDSTIGVYGVSGLFLALFAKVILWASLLTDAPWAIIAIAALSRSWMVVLMYMLPHARDVGLSHAVGHPPKPAMITAAMIGLIASFIFAGALATFVTAGVALGVSAIAHVKIKGQTGDILGACQIITELAGLIVVLALI